MPERFSSCSARMARDHLLTTIRPSEKGQASCPNRRADGLGRRVVIRRLQRLGSFIGTGFRVLVALAPNTGDGFRLSGRAARAPICTLMAWLVIGTGMGPFLYGQWSEGAYRALGQPNLRENGLNGLDGSELWSPSGLAVDSRDGLVHVYVADTRNHRILAWEDIGSVDDGARASKVLGQPSASHFRPLGIGNKGLAFPLGLAVHPATGDLYCADFGNNRVLRFRSPLTGDAGVEPDAVYGQPDFTTNGANFAPRKFGPPDRDIFGIEK